MGTMSSLRSASGLVIAVAGAAALAVACGCPAKAPNEKVEIVKAAIFTSNEITDAQRHIYYHKDEGIQYMPIDVMLALNRVKSSDGGGKTSIRLFDEGFLEKPERFGLFRLEGHDVPVGITISDEDFPMAGINCATCHTAVIRGEGGKVVVVDGAPSFFAINRFVKEMAISTLVTALANSQFNQFYRRYLTIVEERRKLMVAKHATPPPLPDAEPTAEEKAEADGLEAKYRELEADDDAREAKRELPLASDDDVLERKVAPVVAKHTALPLPGSGPLGRKEMRAYLFNRFIYFNGLGQKYSPKPPKVGGPDLGRANPWGVAKNYLAASYLEVKPGWQHHTGGPISTPYLWGFKDVETVFWAGVTNSLVERDFAQGVALLSPAEPRCGSMKTTVSIRKLDAVRRYAALLTAPSWPSAVLGQLDSALAAEGRAPYQEHCAKCHDRVEPPPSNCRERAPIDKATDKPLAAPASLKRYLFCDVGTDAAYTASLMESSPASRRSCASAKDPAPGDLMTDFLGPVFGAVKETAYEREGLDQSKDEKTFEAPRLPAWWLSPTTNAYVAKPLKGVWASSPYLHNGSVPTLRALLEPAKKRPTEFFIGPIDYDVKNGGYRWNDKGDAPFYSRVLTSAPGSSNVGHEYGTDLPERTKAAIVEYIKSL